MTRSSTIQTINPATEKAISSYPLMNKSDIDTILQNMQQTQIGWKQTELKSRIHCLNNLAQLLLQQQETYAQLITNEMGKPIAQSIKEIEKCARLCEYYAIQGPGFLEPEFIETDYDKSYRVLQPLGIIFAIMPWNFPLWQVMRFAIPNLMLGNAGLLKHAPNTTGTSLLIEQMFLQADFPEDLFRSVVIDVSLAPYVIHHPLVAGVTLTGSHAAGQSVGKEAGEAVKKVVLELGGSDPYLILEDADLNLAAEQCVASRLNNAGQVCIAAKRIIVLEKIKEEFETLLLQKAQIYQMGDPLERSTTLGPMARQDLREKLHSQVQHSLKTARCVLGGKIPDCTGYYYPPTVLLDITPDSVAFKEELFGPVICVMGAKTEAEAIQLANQTSFGLAAAIFTRDLEKGEKLAREHLIAGTCSVNRLVSSDPRLPFGGVKNSGYGRELSLEGMREFANIKTVTVSQ